MQLRQRKAGDRRNVYHRQGGQPSVTTLGPQAQQRTNRRRACPGIISGRRQSSRLRDSSRGAIISTAGANILHGEALKQIESTPKPSNSLKKRKFEGQRTDRESKRARNTPIGIKKPDIVSKERLPVKEPKAETVRRNTSASIFHWTREGTWPKEYFEQDDTMAYPLPRTKSSTSLRHKPSTSSNITASDQKPREVKSAPYQDVRYEALLAAKGSYLDEADCGITAEARSHCRKLLEEDQGVPKQSLFDDDIFFKTIKNTRNRNEARVIQDISRLIVPSAETLAVHGANRLEVLIENVNEGWNNAIPLTGTRPQPDYSVGFRSSALSEEQLKKIGPLIGGLDYASYFMATYQCYFPFLTCEVKCGAVALDIADRQNAHSMTLAVRSVVELYRRVKRERELHREILGFSVSHDQMSVRIYGHYALIYGGKTTYYRHPIRKFDFTEQEGKEKWTAYKFIRNVYDIWMPLHLKRICSAIDELPLDLNFEMTQQLVSHFSSDVPLSQQQSNDSFSAAEDNSQMHCGSQQMTPPTSVTQDAQRAFKKPRKRTRTQRGRLHDDINPM